MELQPVLSFESNREHYEAQACVVWCFDWRFEGALKKYLEDQGVQRFDLIKIAGGAKSLASPDQEAQRAFLLRQIKTSIELHHAARIVLMTHGDCGAYGGSNRFQGEAAEREFHVGELQTARNLVAANVPSHVAVEAVFVDFHGVFALKS